MRHFSGSYFHLLLALVVVTQNEREREHVPSDLLPGVPKLQDPNDLSVLWNAMMCALSLRAD